MKIVDEIYTEDKFKHIPFDFYFAGKKGAVFDIETTGLSPKNSALILSGFVIPQEDGRFLCRQIFAESLDDEALVIEQTLDILNKLDYIITYNGISFDIPFLEKRMRKLGIPENDMPYNLDMYKVIRNFSDIGRFTPNLKQKTVESYMGLWQERADEIDGGLSVELYASYLLDRDPECERKILLHNADDVKQLYRLLKALPQCDVHQAMCTTGFPLNSNARICNIALKKDKLHVTASLKGYNVAYKAYDDETGIYVDYSKGSLNISLRLIQEKPIVFADIKDIGFSPSRFENCGGLIRHYLILSQEGNINYQALATLGKIITERILENGLC